MFTLKKKLSLCLALVMLLALLAGCKEDAETVSETPSIDFESQAHIQVGNASTPKEESTVKEESKPTEESTSTDESTIDDSSAPNDESTSVDTSTPKEESTPNEQSQPPLTGEIVVSEKKYDYKGNNIELLHVENQTNLHLNVTVHGTYFDADKEVINEESQTITALPSGQATYVIFYPYKPFDSFTYTVETERYVPEPIHADEDGTPYAAYLTLSFKRDLKWIRWPLFSGKDGRMLCFRGDATNTHPSKTLISQFHVLVLDENGEIYAIDYDMSDPSSLEPMPKTSVSGFPKPPMGVEDSYGKHVYLRKCEKGKEEPISDELQSNFTVIYAISEVVDEEEAMKQAFGQ